MKIVKGFTLIEIIIVMAIMMVLVFASFPFLSPLAFQMRQARAQTDLIAMREGFLMYKMDMGFLPPDYSFNNYQNGGTLDPVFITLLSNPTSSPSWNGPYVDDVMLQDPWGQNYYFADYDPYCCGNYSLLWSLGPDGQNQIYPQTISDGQPRGDDVFALLKGNL